MSDSPEIKLRVLVVCLGNICRSPMGEAVLKDIARRRGVPIVVDSCGTAGYHVGEKPDERTIETCKQHQVPIDSTARRIRTSDFVDFTHILAADESILASIQRIKPSTTKTVQVHLWGSYLDGNPIPDPYYGERDEFEEVFQQCVVLSEAFLDEVTKIDDGEDLSTSTLVSDA